jgi:hypothetical protein
LCANLPIIYGPLALVIKRAKGTGNRSEPRTHDRSGYQGHSERGLYHDWARLNHSGSLADESSEAMPRLPAKQAYTVTTEMDTLEANRIMHINGLKEDG